MKRDIRRALQLIHKRAVNGGEELYLQGICFNMHMLIGDADYTRFKQDCEEEIYKGYKDYSGNHYYPIKSNVVGGCPVDYYLAGFDIRRRWKGEQLQKRIELLEVMIQFYAPKKRVKKDV